MTSSSKNQSTALAAALVVGCLCAILIGAFVWSAHIAESYDGRILPNVSVGDVAVGGLEESAAKHKLQTSLGQDKVRSVSVQVKDQVYTLNAETPDGSFVEPSATLVRKAYQVGRTQNPLINTWNRIRLSAGSGAQIELSVEVSPERLQKRLEPQLGSLLREPTNAQLVIETTPTTTVSIASEQVGVSIDWKEAAKRVKEQINRRATGPAVIPLKETQADLTSTDLREVREQAEVWLHKAPIALVATSTIDKTWSLDTNMLASWITVTSTAPHRAILLLDQTAADRSFHALLGTNIRAAQDGLLELDEQGKLKNFVAPKDGLGPDTAQTLQRIQDAWDTGATSTSLVIRREQPMIRGAAEELGIRELIGRGVSNFSGSPSNRRKNIRLGMERVHGTIIPAGQEFSMIQTLGPIDGEHGWLPELVIKGNKTTPEFGGGLCQIGTTAFRGAMNTGLEITERRNHSYRVRYYEPAGTDATIYDPSPDFKFKNDTNHAILITGEIRGDIVEFSFWGTGDGRKASVSPSRITNITAPPPTKLIETTDLPVGTKKCTETAHAGATARIDYTIERENGETKTVTFTSIYRPWQAVCLVGVASLTPPAAAAGQSVDQTGINNLN